MPQLHIVCHSIIFCDHASLSQHQFGKICAGIGKNLALNRPRTCNVCTVMQACYQSEMNGSIVKGINRLTLFWRKILVFIGDLMVASVM